MIDPNSNLHVYTVARDFGFAPNPFHGMCTLATCKPKIRKSARIGDWVMGKAGAGLSDAKRKCIYLMKVTEKISFEDYWNDPRFYLKKAVRNGSNVQLVGDNIYHKRNDGSWVQEDSHHSNPDGNPNVENLQTDTSSTDQVLVSDFFLYFGQAAIPVNWESIGYKGGIGQKKIDLSESENARKLIAKIFQENKANLNLVLGDPCQFALSHQRADQSTGKLVE
nr:hypothetical protein [Microbulbifer elongatus]